MKLLTTTSSRRFVCLLLTTCGLYLLYMYNALDSFRSTSQLQVKTGPQSSRPPARSDDCTLFNKGSLQMGKKLNRNGQDRYSRLVQLASLNGRSVVVKSPPVYPHGDAAEGIFDDNSLVRLKGRYVTEESLDALIWPGLQILPGFSRREFEEMKTSSDSDRDLLWDPDELRRFLNKTVDMLNRCPSQELFYYRRLSGVTFLLDFFGHCGRQHVVEYLSNGDLDEFLKREFDQKSVMDASLYRIWKQIVLDLIQIMEQLEETNIGPLYHCDIRLDNFGLDAGLRVKMIDIESMYMVNTMDRSTDKQVCTTSEHQCGLEYCRSQCDLQHQRCNRLRRDFNYWYLCQKIFNWMQLITGRTTLLGHLSSKEYNRLQILVNTCSDSTDGAREIVQQIKSLIN